MASTINRGDAAATIAHLRRGLEERGDVGRFLLSQIDSALASGIEEYEDEFTYSKKGVEKRSGKKVVVRRQPTEHEALLVFCQVLKAYLADLPAAIASAIGDLQKHATIGEVVVSFRSDFELDTTAGDIPDDITLSAVQLTRTDESGSRVVKYFDSLVRGAETGDGNATTDKT